VDSEARPDTFDSLRIVLADSEADRNAMLLERGETGTVERDMVEQMRRTGVLAHPDRLDHAHRMVVTGLEVLERNGSRSPQLARVRVVTPVARWISRHAIHYITRRYLQQLTRTLSRLYARREAAAPIESAAKELVGRCRRDVDQIHDAVAGRSLGLPTFLLGGALVTSLGGVLQDAKHLVKSSAVSLSVAIPVLILVLLALSWLALSSAAVARRRIDIALGKPLEELWEAIGSAGRPPQDQCYDFAVYAIVLLVLSWLVAPLGVWLIVTSV